MKHKRLIIDRPYLGAVVSTCLLFFAIPQLASIAAPAVSSALSVTPSQALQICAVIVALLILLLYRLWLIKEPFHGVMSFAGSRVKEVLKLMIIVFVIDFICFTVIAFVDYGGIGNLVLPSVATFIMSLCAGVFEETAFRAIPISIFMKNRPTTGRVIQAVLFTALVFGVAHLSNILRGEVPAIAVYQSIQAIIIGAFLATLYLRSGSILLPMAYHFTHNFVVSMLPDQSTEVMLQQSISIGTLIPDLVLMTCEVVATIYLLRPGCMDEIKAIWRKKWSEE